MKNKKLTAEFLKLYSIANQDLRSFVELEYDDTEEKGIFGFDPADNMGEPFFGLFWCKSNGDEIRSDREFDITADLSVEHARKIYLFLRDYFQEDAANAVNPRTDKQ
jgi:hypothetical protein